ncbi:SRPBCC domain-containing protein [Agromyces aerolatus]|uniref:SRPBCC domain-containing protein n=1 Tax=Agromyces sp. LY-1074 TaxID=3074080 RepID=UPI0028656FE2|nr:MULTISPECIES: SRPBCC domain-containing protein [unclassified Agromyces]MDR5701448.1 SRPBCC domain-containing protein [Agromyces sp. LY-1074]MDR5704485.1 SRPBCC domain-containing protein [Agromyces sp. LY-1358]
MNIASQINEVLRHVEFGESGNVITLQQTFPTSVDDLWDACTTPARLARWFDGELREGGRYRMADSGTVGTIRTCDAPRELIITWEHGDDVSLVTAAFEEAPGGRSATLTVRHHGEDNEYWREYGPAAGGAGWDAAFLGLVMLLDDPDTLLDEVATLMRSADGERFTELVVSEWSRAHQRAGAAADEADAAAGRAAELEREMWAADA